MRIIGGALKGKRLKSFSGRKIRPTSDRVKEALFNIISGEMIRDASVLDLFAGTGNLGIEALSRGAGKTVFVEKERGSLKLLTANLKLCSLDGRSEVIPLDVKNALPLLEKRGEKFDLIFLDPPYSKGFAGMALSLLGKNDIAADALLIIEHSVREALSEEYGSLLIKEVRSYGDTCLSFFKGQSPRQQDKD